MIKTILVGTDGSRHAQHAVAFAAQLALQLDAEVVLAHATVPFPPVLSAMGGSVTYVTQDIIDENRAATKRWVLSELSAPLTAAGVPWLARLCEGSAADELLRAATEVGAQLIVVGTGALPSFGEVLMGSTSHALTHRAPVPVVVVPHGHSDANEAARAHDHAPGAVLVDRAR